MYRCTHARCGVWVVVCAYTQPPCLPTNQPRFRPCQLDPESTQTVMERWYSRGNGVELVSPSFPASHVRPGSVRGGSLRRRTVDSPPIERSVGRVFVLCVMYTWCEEGRERCSQGLGVRHGTRSSGLGTSPSRCTAVPSSGVVAWLQGPSERICAQLASDGVRALTVWADLGGAWDGPGTVHSPLLGRLWSCRLGANAVAWGSGAFLHIGVAVDRKKQRSKRRDKKRWPHEGWGKGLAEPGSKNWRPLVEELGEHRDQTEAIPPGDPLGRLPSGQQTSRRRRHWIVVLLEANTAAHVSAARCVPLDRLMKPAYVEASFWSWVQMDHTWRLVHAPMIGVFGQRFPSA